MFDMSANVGIAELEHIAVEDIVSYDDCTEFDQRLACLHLFSDRIPRPGAALTDSIAGNYSSVSLQNVAELMHYNCRAEEVCVTECVTWCNSPSVENV